MIKIKDIQIKGYKKVIEVTDAETNLHSFIAIHDSSLGPALGGVRMYPYQTIEEALTDVLRLAKGMTYKSAIAQNGLGGGKSVIIGDPQKDKTEMLLFAFAEGVNSLEGEYIAAEDVGTSTEDMYILNKKTPYVCALPIENSSGDPSRFTTWGIFRGIQIVAQTLWGSTSIRQKIIAIQGLGSVGSKLADRLFWEGANLILCDIEPHRVHSLALLYGAPSVEPKNYYKTACDILAPCAMGGIINDETLSQFECKAIAGSANNQLLLEDHGRKLMELGILYAPDYIINAGGIINAAAEFLPGGYDPKAARDKTDRISDTLLEIFRKSKETLMPTNQIANEMAKEILRKGIGKRITPIDFHR